MCTMALPIRELEQSVAMGAEKARAETECVAAHSKASRADLGTACKVAAGTIVLKWLFAALVRSQGKLISAYVEHDFSHYRREDLAQLSSSLDEIVAKDRAILDKVYILGAEIRVWWNASITKLEDQAEHLDSISESLRLAADAEGTALMAMAVEEFVMQ
jgi:hypothetical protein